MIDKATLKRVDKIFCDDCVILCDNRNHPVKTCRETIDKMVAEIDQTYKPREQKAHRNMDMVQIWYKYLEALAKYISSQKRNRGTG